MPQFTSWSASRLGDYELCPHMAMHKHLLKTCTVCFKGKMKGGFDGVPVTCSNGCGPIKKGPALERGDDVGNRLDKYLLGKAKKPPVEIVHPAVLTLLPNVRQEIKKGQGKIQFEAKLTRKWALHEGEPWSPLIWFRGKLDYLFVEGKLANVTDWKTGGIDKQTGQVKAQAKYDDQLNLYQIVTLVTHPEVQEVSANLCFLDCKPAPAGLHPSLVCGPMVRRDRMLRKDLKKEQRRWEKKTLKMFVDDTFAPRAGEGCRFCPYQKGRGGPCPY